MTLLTTFLLCQLHAVHVSFNTLVAWLDFVQFITGGPVILGTHAHCHGHDVESDDAAGYVSKLRQG